MAGTGAMAANGRPRPTTVRAPAAAAGALVLGEVESLRKVTDSPERPFVVVLGGAKIADKLGVIDSLLGKADRILIGGGMAYTFQKAKGLEIGRAGSGARREPRADCVRRR